MARYDFPVLLGPTKTVSGRRSTVASTIGPKSATESTGSFLPDDVAFAEPRARRRSIWPFSPGFCLSDDVVMSDSLRGSVVRRFDGRKVYAGAIEAGSQAAPSPGHAAALLQTGAFPRSLASPSLRPCLRSPAPDASPQARHGSIPGRASCPRLGSRPRTLPSLNRTHARAGGARGCSTPAAAGCRVRSRWRRIRARRAPRRRPPSASRAPPA